MYIIIQNNKWKKRGLSLVPMGCGHFIKNIHIQYHCLVSVFAGDGTISVTHAGLEMGQGINTKVRKRFLSSIVTTL